MVVSKCSDCIVVVVVVMKSSGCGVVVARHWVVLVD